MDSKVRSHISAAVFGVLAMLLGLRSAVGERLSTDDGATILEYVLLVAMVVAVLGVAVNALGGSISGFVNRMVTKISNL